MRIPIALDPGGGFRPGGRYFNAPAAKHEPCLWMLKQSLDHSRYTRSVEAIVVVEELHERSAGVCDRRVRSPALAGSLAVNQQLDPIAEALTQEGHGTVARCVVDYHHLGGLVVLMESRLDGSRDQVCAVEHRHADGDQRA